ncbi:MAG TPA: hypothetical protein VF657_06495 [Actinoplanes sp.]
MEEQEFWGRLEFRVCAEFQGFAGKQLRHYWCDGLVAEEYDFSAAQPQVRGHAWCGATGSEHWQFTLILTPGTRSREAIDWPALLPADKLTGWLLPDPHAKSMIIHPLDGYQD